MAEEKKEKLALDELKLPPSVVGQADLARLVREAESLDSWLEAQKVHGEKVVQPKLSESMNDFLELNKIDNIDPKELAEIREYLRKLKDHLPVVHFVFPAETEPEYVQQLVEWVRSQVYPRALVSIGVQPSLVGGVYVRTSNHVYDFSIGKALESKRSVLVQDLQKLGAAK